MTEYEEYYYNSIRDFKPNSFPEIRDVNQYMEKRIYVTSKKDEAITKFGFAVLTEEVINAIRPYNPILEVGAGTGYWAYEMQKRGVDCIATDPGDGHWFVGSKRWTEIEGIDGVNAVKKYPDRSLLLCWPYMESWPAETLRIYKGNTVIYVGEGYEGCTADDAFHEILEKEWNLKEEIDIPQWDGIHDHVFIYQRLNAVQIDGFNVVEPQHLLSFYKTVHTSGGCIAVREAKILLAQGINPVGREELIKKE
jgi:hypothetical protein